MYRISVKGVAAAAGMIFLMVAVAILAIWGLGLNDPDAASRINTWWILCGFALLLAGALVVAYFSATRKLPAATAIAGVKLVCMQLLRALLSVIGVVGLLLVLGSLME